MAPAANTSMMRSLFRLIAPAQPSWQQRWNSVSATWHACSSSRTASTSSFTGGSSRTSSSSDTQAMPDPSAPDQLPADSESYYWIPHTADTFKPDSIAQRRAAGRLETAIESVMLADAAIREHLVERYGLTIHRIQLAKDRRTVFVLWDAQQGKAEACQQALEKHAFRLRRDLAKNLNSKHTPFLEFRHNHLPPLKAAVAAAMEQVEAEAAAATAAAGSTSQADAGSDSGPATADVEAAIARLEAATQPVQTRQ